MALKITTQIGTDKGITSEAYVRISDYQVSKYGNANFRIELFQSEDEKPSGGTVLLPVNSPSKNQQIGESLLVSLTKDISATRTVAKSVEVITPSTTDEEGNIIPESRTWETQEVEETYTKTVPDLSDLEEGTIFEFGYAKLRAKLQELFGAENIIDC